MNKEEEKEYQFLLDGEQVCLAVAAQCMAVDRFAQEGQKNVAQAYKEIADSLMLQANMQGLDVVQMVKEKSNEKDQDDAASDE